MLRIYTCCQHNPTSYTPPMQTRPAIPVHKGIIMRSLPTAGIAAKFPLAEYRKLMDEKVHESRRPMTWFVMQRVGGYTPIQLAAMKAHAEPHPRMTRQLA